MAPLGVTNDGEGLDYFIPAADEVNADSLPPAFQNGFIGFVIGAKHFTKQLPKEKIVSIIQKLHQPVILLGGKEDAENGNWIISNLSAQNDGVRIPSDISLRKESFGQISNLVINSCGKYNLNQSASLVRQAKKIITHDTGLMHIAASFKKEIVSVWGNTIPEFGMHPYYGKFQVPNLKSQISNLNCRPCSKLGYPQCPKIHFRCMTEINEEEIVKFVNS